MLSKRVRMALELAGYDPAASPAMAELVALAGTRPSIDPHNYYHDWRDQAGIRAYRADCRKASAQWSRVRALLSEAGAEGVTDADILAEAPHAFSGRLSWDGAAWEYTPGQYYPMEYRQAVGVLLAAAIRRVRRARPPAERRCSTIAQLMKLNAQNGGTWLGAAEMRFFGTHVESGIVRGKYFVTSEQPPDGGRRYTVRTFDAHGDVSTVGEFCGYDSRAAAMAAVPRE